MSWSIHKFMISGMWIVFMSGAETLPLPHGAGCRPVRTGSELCVPSAVGWQVGEETCCGHPISLKVFWQLSLDKELIDFGSYTVGETAIRTITLTNTGGLGTKFRFLLASEPCKMDTSQSALKLVSVLLLLVNAMAAQPRAARGISCPR